MSDSKKQINVNQVVNYLNHAFSSAAQKVAPAIGTNNTKGSKLYEYQVEFAYLINEIQRGPKNFVPKAISDANELISKMLDERMAG